ncbi:hypothetical protein [Bacteroides sp.]|uniref:hypothetical protein n=1 Tax=Bacteroides sp. TaxID=29523 RepID=UPI002631AE9F|nr:hypothetical protein [Bacteroides sp.]MDD3039044.1 hypothetical protein [Bacteroides sp.]
MTAVEVGAGYYKKRIAEIDEYIAFTQKSFDLMANAVEQYPDDHALKFGLESHVVLLRNLNDKRMKLVHEAKQAAGYSDELETDMWRQVGQAEESGGGAWIEAGMDPADRKRYGFLMQSAVFKFLNFTDIESIKKIYVMETMKRDLGRDIQYWVGQNFISEGQLKRNYAYVGQPEPEWKHIESELFGNSE